MTFRPIFITLLCGLILFASCQKKETGYLTTEQLYSEFQNPDSHYRPFVRWWWNGDKVEADELVRELRLLKDAGIGGVEINPVEFPSYCDSVGKTSLQWLSPEWIDMLDTTFKEAEQLDMTCDLIVGSGWPFGAEILQGEELAQIVVNYGEPVTGPMTWSMERDSLYKKALPKISSPYEGSTKEILSLRLYPNPADNAANYIDLTEMGADSLLTIEVPEGDYTLSALIKINGFMEVINGAPGAAGPVLNHFNTAAVNKYLYNMSDSIQGRIGPLMGKIRALFTDSMELEGANWVYDMADTFKERYGYDIVDYLPFILFKIGGMGSALNYDAVVPVTEAFNEKVERARYDFEDFKARLMKERFTEPYIAWCHGLGVKARAQAYGRGFYPLENAMGYDLPEGESWTTNYLHHKPGEEMSEQDYRRGRAYTMVNKFVSSAAHLAGNRIMSCEEMTNTYTVFNMTLEQLKLGGDQTAISGVSHTVFHGFNYSPNQEAIFPGWLRYGAYYSENNTWWPYFKYYNDYKARLACALQHGTYYADIAILNPENDMWSTIGMQNEPFPNTTRAKYKTLIWEAINKTGGGVDYVTENILNEGSIKKGQFCYNDRKYNTLILIDVERMHPETAKQVLQFVETGGKVICIDTIPYKSLGLYNNYIERDSIIKTYFETIQGFEDRFVFAEPPIEGFIGWYDSLMKAEALPHYLDIEEPDAYLMQNRYTTDDGSEMFFISHSHRYDSHRTKITFSSAIVKGKTPTIWDLHTGKRYLLPLEEDLSYTFDFGPADSYLVVFQKKGDKNLPIWQPMSQVIGEMQESDLSKDWEMALEPYKVVKGEGGCMVSDTIVTDTLFDLKDSEVYQHFAGTIVYSKTFDAEQGTRTILDLGKVEGITEVIVNGQSAGVQYFGRRQYDISELILSGKNQLEVRVTTTLGNWMKTFTRDENLPAWVYLNNRNHNQDLQSQGMMGPVSIYQ